MTTMIDTHRLIKRLTTEGAMSEKAAEALSEAINEALTDTVATKADIEAVRKDIETAVSRIGSEFSNRLLVHTGVVLAGVFALLKWVH